MQNPQAILLDNSQDAYYNPTTLVQYNMTSTEKAEKFLKEIVKRKEVAGTDAAKNGRMLILEEMMVDGTRSYIGSIYLAKWLYPDLFEDLNPEEVHEEYFEKWLGVPYKEYGHIRLPAKWLFGLFNVGGMNMRGSTFALMITCAALMIGSAFAQGIVVPGDSDGDKIVSAEEVAAAEKLAQEGKLSADDLQEIKHIHEKYPINIH